LGSEVLTAKFSNRGNDDHELLEFKASEVPFPLNSKTFKVTFGFQGLSRSWKSEKNENFFKDF